jgi:hypothetical protein
MRFKQFVRFSIWGFMVPAVASAQRSVEIGPLFALYAPTGSYHHQADYFRVGTPEHPDENGAAAWGGEGRFWMNRRLGLQLQGVTSSANHATVNTPAGAFASSTRVTSVTAQAVYVLSPGFATSRLWLAAGGGMMRHSGSAYTPYGSPTNPVGAVGLGSSIALSRSLAASIGVTSLLYHWQLSDSRGLYQRGFETDVLAHAGLALSLR